jgi:hypothetical protein
MYDSDVVITLLDNKFSFCCNVFISNILSICYVLG